MKNYMQLSTWIKMETEKAFAIEFSNGRQGSGASEIAWFPKSQCSITHPENYADPDRKLIEIPVWLTKNYVHPTELGRFDGYMGAVKK